MCSRISLQVIVLPATILFLLAIVVEGLPVIPTNIGPIRGTVLTFAPTALKLKQNGTVIAYRGIPYAKPPEGERRFRPPEPLDPWEEVYDATEVPSSCPQVIEPFTGSWLPNTGMSEDCLYLNIYVPLAAPANAPLMIWIHGGSFNSNSGSDYIYNALPLAVLGEVIVITINYRLNIFGFFSTGDDAIPGNLGLMDQRQALRWVHENIAAFGGDPNKITIFGESAGAASVGFHVLTAESRKFFNRAILQSGSPFNQWAIPISTDEARTFSARVANIGGCSPSQPGDTSYIADCLRSKTMEELVDIVKGIESATDPVWIPVNDGQFFASDVFSLARGNDYSDIDILVGLNKDEGTFASFILSGLSLSRPFISKDVFAAITTPTDNPLLLGLLEAVYAADIDDTGNYLDALSAGIGDSAFVCSVLEFAKLVSTVGSKTFMYQLTIEPKRSLWNATWLKASHIEDIQFVFGLPFADHPFYPPVYEERKVSYYVIRMWTNFAKTGDPNIPQGFPKSISEWPQFIPGEEMYKELDISFNNNQGLRSHYCNFWTNLFPEILRLQAAAAATTAEDVDA